MTTLLGVQIKVIKFCTDISERDKIKFVHDTEDTLVDNRYRSDAFDELDDNYRHTVSNSNRNYKYFCDSHHNNNNDDRKVFK